MRLLAQNRHISNYSAHLLCCKRTFNWTSLLKFKVKSLSATVPVHENEKPNLVLSRNWKGCYYSYGLHFQISRQFHETKHLTFGEDTSSFEKYRPVFLQAEKHLNKTAIVDQNGKFSYADILHHSMVLNLDILKLLNAKNNMLYEQRIALLTDNDVSFVIGQYATWIANGISVPLCNSHPPSEWEYFIEDSKCDLILTGISYLDKIGPVAQKLGIPVKILSKVEEIKDDTHLNSKNRWFLSEFASSPNKVSREFERRKKRWFDHEEEFAMKRKPALIIYTSGTTGRPKGVVLTHGNLSAMISGMIKSWEWSPLDVILHVLPLHHVHGIVNVLLTPLACGATCVMEKKFDAGRVWNLLTKLSIDDLDRSINLFMAVPTVYAKMIQFYEENICSKNAQLTSDFIRATLKKKIRLMVSGSSALPQPVSDRWFKLTGHRLLERYGMTEIGMALTNPLHGDRVVGAVGNPFPDVSVRIVKQNVYNPIGYDILVEGNHRHTVVSKGSEYESGELLVKGPSVFQQYWNKPEATAESFTKDGWFKTGDTAVYKDGMYRIVGRTSVDIIKSGGYKISALDVERHLLSHPNITDCAVVGLPDITWGQKVAAVVVTKDEQPLILEDLRQWAKQHLASYQIPTIVTTLSTMPRNAMGKVNKKELVVNIFPEHKRM